jgi:hypothetical protein
MAKSFGICNTGGRHRGIKDNPALKDEIRELYLGGTICRECYDHRRYFKQQVAAANSDPEETLRVLGGVIGGVGLLQKAGRFSKMTTC